MKESQDRNLWNVSSHPLVLIERPESGSAIEGNSHTYALGAFVASEFS